MPGKIMNPDSKVVGEFAAAGCSNSEIADILGCSKKMIGARRFAAILAKNRAEVRKHLRQVQIEAALGGSVMMMIWLGRQLLGQTSENDVSVDAELSDPEQLIVVLDEKKKGEMIDGETMPETQTQTKMAA
ncbi:MAG TPA: hypothetical protein VMG59_01640 [Phycisphaerae bacterium]|nr:hypothetical protein [Phycisphaerae bacterium]